MSNRIILIDDDRSFGDAMAGKLRALGYHHVVVVDKPLEAAAAFNKTDAFRQICG